MPKKPNIVAVIPARYGSTRLPGKPLIEIAGKPMIQHVVERVEKAALVDRVIVATDDKRVAQAVERFGGTVVMTPSDVRSGSDRVALVAKDLPQVDIIVNVQGDEPLIEPAMIDEAVQPLLDDEKVVAGTLVKRIDDEKELKNPNIVKVVMDHDGFALYFSRSPIPFNRNGSRNCFRHVGLYVFRRTFLATYTSLPATPLEKAEQLEQLRILEHGYKIKTIITEHDSIPIDTDEDVKRVVAQLERARV